VITSWYFSIANKWHYLQASKNGDVLPAHLQSSVQPPEQAHASSSSDHGPSPSSNGNTAHEDGQNIAGLQKTTTNYSRLQSIVIDPETGEARNAATGETMEMPLRSPRLAPSTPPPVPITEFQQLATESDLKVRKSRLVL
jgi:hypothetical protein